jgi:hypothetical protein
MQSMDTQTPSAAQEDIAMTAPTFELPSFPFSAATVLLAGLALASAFIAVEQLHRMKKVRRENRLFVQEANPLLVDWRLEAIALVATHYPSSPLAKLFSRMTSGYLAGLQAGNGEGPMAVVEREAELGLTESMEELRRRLPLLPLSAALAIALGSVGAISAVTFSQALPAFLVGSFVALASLGTYRHLKQRIFTTESALQLSADELIYEMACNCDRDTMHEVLSYAA